MRIFSLMFLIPVLLFSGDWENYRTEILKYQSSIPGWCKPEKATKMMDLIYETQPDLCVEIGVFGGSSIYPTACALKYLKQGVIYGIDPWATQASTEGYDSDDVNYQWWSKLNYEKIYSDYLLMLKRFQLTQYTKTLRMTSVDAVEHFADASIDILHIDGNHSEESALRDATLFFPKVKANGYIWFDDVNWNTTNTAVSWLLERCDLLLDRSVGQECFLFQKRND